jgi:DNA mismatch endonuclease (patch repair protein)
MHGCFWHCHDCAKGESTPVTNEAFWKDKRAANVDRDARTVEKLSAAGWAALVVWECQLRDAEALTRTLLRFVGKHRRGK